MGSESRQTSFVIMKQEQALSPRNSRFNGRNEVSNNPKIGHSHPIDP